MYTDEEFARIMNEYGDTVLRICYVRLRSLHDAQDAFQDVFLQLYRTKNKPSDDLLKPWLIRVACNRCVSLIRRSKHTEELSGNEEAPKTSVHDSAVRDALMKLNKAQRTAIYMFYYENMSTAEIAECMDIGESNVRVTLHRGREKLKTLLKEEDYEF